MITIERLKNIAEDIIADDEWVKETFKLDHDIELEDEEITEIEFEEIT